MRCASWGAAARKSDGLRVHHDHRLVRSRTKAYVSGLRAFYREPQKVDGKLMGTVAKRLHTKKAAHQA